MRLHRNLIRAIGFAIPVLVAGGAHAGPVDGLWCGQGLLNEFSLKLKQLGGQQVEGTLMRRDRTRVLEGSLSGNTLRTQATKYGSLILEATGGELKIMGGDGPLALAKGTAFRRAAGLACSG
jgi:hypothetical protein